MIILFFKVALERKQGISNLELICKELLEEEQAKEQRREQKRQKRKKKKGTSKASDETEECKVNIIALYEIVEKTFY